jgi:hypothetical protein
MQEVGVSELGRDVSLDQKGLVVSHWSLTDAEAVKE